MDRDKSSVIWSCHPSFEKAGYVYPYEILQPGGSVEYNNEEPGAEWLQRLTNAFPKFAWINPEPQGVWQYRQSIAIVQQLVNQRMFALSLAGLEGAMRLLSK